MPVVVLVFLKRNGPDKWGGRKGFFLKRVYRRLKVGRL